MKASQDFVTALQKDISESLSGRPKISDETCLLVRYFEPPAGDIEVTPQLAKQILSLSGDKRLHRR